MSPYLPVEVHRGVLNLDSFEGYMESLEGAGSRVFEVSGLSNALQRTCKCSLCGGGPIDLREDPYRREGLVTYPYLYCQSCGEDYSRSSKSNSVANKQRRFALNQKSVLANKCVGGTHKSLQMHSTMMNLPLPVCSTVYTKISNRVKEASIQQVQVSMEQARHEVLEQYNIDVTNDGVADILVSCDGTWQKRGFTSMYGACFVIAYETGKVVDYAVMSKYCTGCRKWEKHDKKSQEYLRWKAKHICDANYEGSSGGMEPHGMVMMFQRSLDFRLRYKYLISDGDSKSHSLILESQPYGSSCKVEKKDCIGHIQKRMGTALRDLVQRYRGRKILHIIGISGASLFQKCGMKNMNKGRPLTSLELLPLSTWEYTGLSLVFTIALLYWL